MSVDTLFETLLPYITAHDEPADEVVAMLQADPALVRVDGGGGYTILQIAIGGSVEIVRTALELGADPNVIDSLGRSCLHLAVIGYENDPDIVELLLEHGANPNVRDTDGRTPLFYAAFETFETEKIEKRVHSLLDHGADPNIRDPEGNTVLHMPPCHPAMVLLLKAGADVNALNNKGVPPIVRATEDGVPGIVKLLVQYGADINVADPGGWTPLHHASFDRDKSIASVKRLLKYGADMSARDNRGRTPLHLAAGSHFIQAVRVLLKAGADTEARDSEGKTPLDLVEQGPFLGLNPYYIPPPIGEGDPKDFEADRKKVAAMLRDVRLRP